VVEELAVAVLTVQTGSPPFLKCGEAARAGDEVKTIAANRVASQAFGC
jgi:hypothetical protein